MASASVSRLPAYVSLSRQTIAVLRVLLKLQIDKVSADKAGSAGDNDRFTHNQYRTFPAATFLRCSP